MLEKQALRQKRHRRVRKRVIGTSERPRLNVFRSIAHIYAQVVDDSTGRTIVSASSVDKELKGKAASGGNVEAAKLVGELRQEGGRKGDRDHRFRPRRLSISR